MEWFIDAVFICISHGLQQSMEWSLENGQGGGHRASKGTDVVYQQVQLKVEACLDRAAPDSFSGFETTLLLLLLPSTGGECLPERGFKSCPS